jgi:DNA-binding transcriptional regulator YdaS (Cro superfamily)
MNTKENTPIQLAAELSGGISSLASFCEVSPPAVFKWIEKNRAPADRCIQIEKATKGKITRYQLRPDDFGLKK